MRTARWWTRAVCALVLCSTAGLAGCGGRPADVQAPPAVKSPVPAAVSQPAADAAPSDKLVIPGRDPFEPLVAAPAPGEPGAGAAAGPAGGGGTIAPSGSPDGGVAADGGATSGAGLELLGVYAANGVDYAYLRHGDTYREIREGETFEGYRVGAVDTAAGKVTLTKDGRAVVLTAGAPVK